MLRPVYTQSENCQDCYKCVRECPVKAIGVANNIASIIDDRCIFCGHCTQVCPTGAKKVRDGLTRALMTVERNPNVYLSLAPSYVSEFPGVGAAAMASAVRRLGFRGVSETALGAELVSARTDAVLGSSGGGIHISSACPVTVGYICKYAPEYRERITPVVSPMIAHAMMLREMYGGGIKVIFAGPCVAKKTEADDNPGLIDVAITFRDLREWFAIEGIDPTDGSAVQPGDGFVPYSSRSGSYYPVEGGMIEGLHGREGDRTRCLSFSGLETIKEVLSELGQGHSGETLFLELLACRGGCVNGPAKLNSLSPAVKRGEVYRCTDKGDPRNDFRHMDLSADFSPENVCGKEEYTEKEILEALAAVGKTTPEDEINCSGCGYDSCRDFAVAMLGGRAESTMCASYMRRIANDKATVLLHKIPAGVVIVNDRMEIVDMNRAFAAALGEDAASVYNVRPGMEGASLERLASFAGLFRTVLATGEELSEQRIREGGLTYLLSVYNIQPHHLVFGILQGLHDPTVHKAWMTEKTREVIRRHITTVQEVARLLGENAAFTDSTLRSVIDTLDTEEGKGKD